MKDMSLETKECFSGCYISEEETNGRLIAVNEKFLAMSWKYNGRIVIVDSSKLHIQNIFLKIHLIFK